MFCPNCGKANSIDQKFCRSCGFNLEETSRSVTQQQPTIAANKALTARKEFIEKVLLTICGVGLTIFVIILIWLIVTDIILGKGQIAGGILGIAFILGMAISLVLIVYRQVLIDAAAKGRPAAPETPLPEAQTRQLGESTVEPIPSVTEPTTDLLIKEQRRN